MLELFTFCHHGLDRSPVECRMQSESVAAAAAIEERKMERVRAWRIFHDEGRQRLGTTSYHS